MRYGSLFSGIGGFDLGFDRAGMECRWQVEIDKKAREVLARHWPEVARYEDVKNIGGNNLEKVDLICGGFPCQDLSVAGRREGLAGARSGLWHEFRRVLAECRPQWAVIENVPGLLSSGRGRDFAIVVQGLARIGYGVAWRVLDSQYFGVAQRRRRVFIVGSLGDGRAAEVLFEREGGGWHPAPRRETGARVAPTIAGGFDGAGGGNRPGINADTAEGLIAFDWQSGGDVRLNVNGHHTSALQANQTPAVAQAHHIVAAPVTASYGKQAVRPGGPTIAWHENKQGQLTPDENGKAKALRSGASHSYQGVGVRRLTPTECARLQGFPDDWNDWLSDSARYRQYGNAVTVNVAEWIGKRVLGVLNGR